MRPRANLAFEPIKHWSPMLDELFELGLRERLLLNIIVIPFSCCRSIKCHIPLEQPKYIILIRWQDQISNQTRYQRTS